MFMLKFLLGLFVLSMAILTAQAQYDLVVAKDGSGNFTTVQAAINAAPTGRTTPYRIFIHNGKYQETVNIPASKPFIQLIGESVAGTLITFSNAASTPLAGGGMIGTFNSATVIINASDFSAMNISFENAFGDGSQAVAVQVNGDRVAFSNCRFLGNQDTLLTNGITGLRQYFKDCYIDGNVDFIFGSAIAVFDSCIIYAKTRTTSGSSFITAANTQAGQTYGYVLRNCKIPSNTGGTLYYLGRPWQNSTGASPVANNKVVFLNAVLGSTIQQAGWTIWDAGTNTNLIFDAEYKSQNFDGSPTNISQRVPWSFQLGDADTATYSLANVFGNWDPCSASPGLCAFQSPAIVISNFKAIQGATLTSLTWNISWPISGVQYQLFRGTPATRTSSTFVKVGETDATNDTSVNFSLTDTLPPPGGYLYYIRASAPGETTLLTDTLSVGVPVASNPPDTVPPAPPATSTVLLHWPMSIDATDNPSERSVDVAPDTATLNRLFVSNGTTVPTVPGFSSTFGEAFGSSSNGDGTWTAAVGGPGGTLNRGVYEQFVVRASGSDSVRVDSLILNSSFYNTSSSTKLAAVYSLSGFASDSTDVTGGTGPSGPLAATANGAFATPIALPNETATTSANYRLALAGATGVMVPGGSTLTIRLYFSCSSSSAGRYGKVKDVFIKGAAKAAPVIPSLALSGSIGSFFQDQGIPSNARAYTLTGTNLSGPVSVIAPTGYEISPDAGITWFNSTSPLSLLPNAAGAIDTAIAVRLDATATGSYAGNIVHISNGADTIFQPVTGTTGSNATLPLAFPGAEGFGRFAQGGRGGTVYQVTNLNDDGPGSLRDAVSQPNRTIVFRVSGVIFLNSTLKITSDNLTIAGQTSPGGICTAGYTVTIAANNIIIRYMRFRLGDIDADIDDACNSFKGSFHDIIIDHCSMSWSVDETGSFYDIQQFTLQWNILSESLYHSVDPKGNHGYAGIWGGQGTTFHHNLLASHSSRNPRFSGSRYLGNTVTGTVDMRNNVIYNWGDINSSYGGEGGTQNMINNYYKPGPATPGNLTVSSVTNKRNRILNYTSFYFADDAFIFPDTVFGGKFYIDGNFVEGFPDVSADNWTKGVQPDDYPRADSLIALARQSVPYPFAPVNTQSAPDAYTSVLNNSGALFPQRDTVDRRILREARTGTADFEGAAYAAVTDEGVTHPSGIIDSQNDVGGWPVIVSTAPLPDSDADGMPDVWEIRRGLHPTDPTDRNGISPNGYTNLENFLNGDSITAPGILNAVVSAPVVTLTGAGNWISARDTASSLQIYTDTTNLIASLLDNGNDGNVAVSYYTTGNIRLLPNTRPYLSRNICILPAGGAAPGGTGGSFSAPLTVRVYFTTAEFNALQAADTSIKSINDLAILQVDTNTCLSVLSGAFSLIRATASGNFGTYNNGYYLEFQASSPGNFFIAGSASAALPPFAILSFNALASGSVVNTMWTTNNLLGVSDFVVERATDTTNFQPAGTVTTADSTGHFSYAFQDTHPVGHAAWYRLKAQLTDSAAVYSAAVEVGSNEALLVVPNPANHFVLVLYPELLLEKKTGQSSLELYSAAGQLIHTYAVPAGSLETTIDVSGLANGIYILVLNSNGKIGTTSFIKF